MIYRKKQEEGTNTEISRKQRQVQNILSQQSSLLSQLGVLYQQFKMAMDRNQQLHNKKQELDRGKLSMVSHQTETEVIQKKKLLQLKQECSRKQSQLTCVKKQMLSNAAQLKQMSKQCGSVKQEIKAKEQQFQSTEKLRKQHLVANNHAEVELKQVSKAIREQQERKLRLKKELMQVRLKGIECRSGADLKNQISVAEKQHHQMKSIIRQMHSL